MISHRAARLALRGKLLTLAVCTTGSTTLEATATGYARAAGSFLTDGFAVGAEVAPTGFTQTATGVITALTALTMTISGGRTVQAAGAARTLSVGLPAMRAWENVAFTPTAGAPYVTEQYVPGPGKKISLGPLGELEYLPLFAPHVHVPSGVGPEAGDAYADALLTLFAPETSITLANSTLRVRGDVAPYSGQLLQSAPGFATIPVNVPLRLRTANAI